METRTRYRFIGTEQDLIDNGFRLVDKVWGDSNYLRDVEGDDTLEIYINMDPLGERVVQNNLGLDELIIPHIQDLIEKNLVREYRDENIPIRETRVGGLILNILRDEQVKELRLWYDSINKYKTSDTTLEIPLGGLNQDKDIIQHDYASDLLKGVIDRIEGLGNGNNNNE